MSKKIVILVVAIVLLLAVGGGALTTHIIGNNLSARIGDVDIPEGALASAGPLPQNFVDAISTPSDGKPVNILVLGSDTRNGDNSKYGDPTVFDTARSDTTMLVHLSGDRTGATVMSVPRDLSVTIPSCVKPDGTTTQPHEDKFNAAYSLAGAACTVKTFTSITNIPVNHVVEIDFTGFKNIVNTVGGIDVCVQEPINDTNAQIKLPVGQYTVNGEQALGLARARYTLGDGSDISRIQRQQILFKSMIGKIKDSATVTDPKTMYNVLSETLNSISTDKNLKSLPALATLAWQSRNMSEDSIEFVTMPSIDRGDGATVVLDTIPAKKLFNTIIQDRPASSPTASPVQTSPAPPVSPDTETADPSPSTLCTITPIN